jgi:hypothetical protein
MSISTPTISEVLLSNPNDDPHNLKVQNDHLNEDGSLMTDKDLSSECVSLESEVIKIKEITDSLTISAKDNLKKHLHVKNKMRSQSLNSLDIQGFKKAQGNEKSNEATQEFEVFTKSKGDYSPLDVDELIKSNSELSVILSQMQGQLKSLQEKYERHNRSLEKIQETNALYIRERDASFKMEDKSKSTVCSCRII